MTSPLPPFDPNNPALNFRRLMFLRGPNLWSRNPVVEVWVDLANLKDWSSELIPGFNERYKAWLPTVIEHRCSEGVRGGFFQRLDRGTYLAHILEHTALELQTLAGVVVGFGRAREMSEEGVYKVAIRYEEESVAEKSLFAARDLLLACIYDQPYDVATVVREIHDLADRRCLGPSSKAILAVATQRNIPYRRLSQGSLVQLGQGFKQRRIWTAVTDRTGSIAEAIASDKQLTRQLLTAVHVPVPEGRLASDAEDAWQAALEIKGPVVIKPRDANHGRGVFPNLTQKNEITDAYHEASKEGSGVIVERFVPGIEHRVLVVGGQVVAATCGRPVCVTGDGQHNIQQLIDLQVNSDPRRGEDESQPLSPIAVSPGLLLMLKQQKLSLTSAPDVGVEVIIKRYDNLSEDVTDLVHPEVAARAVLAARTVGLDIAGIDMVLEDISQTLESQRGAIVEVNAGPGLLMHLAPSKGKSRPVGEFIINHMFGITDDARIPVVCVTGTNGKTTVTRIVRKILAAAGHTVGLADSAGVCIGNWIVSNEPSEDAASARDTLANPDVTAGVFEANADGILRAGLGFDKCDVAIVTNLAQPDHLGGEFDIWSDEKMFAVKRTPVDVVMERGTAVLNAADTLVMQMKPLCKGDVILFGTNIELPAIQQHISEGKRAVVLAGDSIYLCADGQREPFLNVAAIGLTDSVKLPFQLENVMASIAAAWHLKIDSTIIASALRSLDDPAVVSRCSVRLLGPRTLIACKPKNLAAIEALQDSFSSLESSSGPTRRAIVFAVQPDCRQEDLQAQGAALVRYFDEVFLFPAADSMSPSAPQFDHVTDGIAEGNRLRSGCVKFFRCPSASLAFNAALEGSCATVFGPLSP
jgi:cyanophycin synthetase